jgi:polyribonucleotide nucleotidyltransferase
MLGAVVFGHEQMQIAIQNIRELAAQAGKPKWDWKPAAFEAAVWPQAVSAASAEASGGLRLISITEKTQRHTRG